MSPNTKYVTAYYLDAQDGRPANDVPPRHGPVLPSEAMTIDAVDRRQRPALIIGTLPASESLAPGMELVDQAEHQALVDDYQQWRDGLADAARQDLLHDLADHRFEVETAGVMHGGQKILTDRESQSQLSSAERSLDAAFLDSINWKSADGWITVTQAELKPIARAVAQHVQGSFTAERNVCDRINSGEDVGDYADAFDDELALIKEGFSQ